MFTSNQNFFVQFLEKSSRELGTAHLSDLLEAKHCFFPTPIVLVQQVIRGHVGGVTTTDLNKNTLRYGLTFLVRKLCETEN